VLLLFSPLTNRITLFARSHQNAEGVERWFCAERELKQDDHCERAERDDWYATLDECEEAGCRGKKDCRNIFCQTDEPTSSPTSSPQPSPAPTTGTPTTSPTALPSSSPSPPPSTSEPTDQHLSNLKKCGVSVVKETLDGHERINGRQTQ